MPGNKCPKCHSNKMVSPSVNPDYPDHEYCLRCDHYFKIHIRKFLVTVKGDEDAIRYIDDGFQEWLKEAIEDGYLGTVKVKVKDIRNRKG